MEYLEFTLFKMDRRNSFKVQSNDSPGDQMNSTQCVSHDVVANVNMTKTNGEFINKTEMSNLPSE